MKKFAKKFTALLSLITCVTIGGVYAAWSYAANASLSETINKGVTLTPVTHSGSLGEYEVSFAEFSLLIDQTAPGDYTPRLSYYVESDDGSLDFKFTPAVIASDAVKTYGMESTIIFSSTLQHEGEAIFSFPTSITVHESNSEEATKWTLSEDGTYFTFSISNADLANYIVLNYTSKLDTYAKYQAFETSLTTGTVNITIAHTEGGVVVV